MSSDQPRGEGRPEGRERSERPRGGEARDRPERRGGEARERPERRGGDFRERPERRGGDFRDRPDRRGGDFRDRRGNGSSNVKQRLRAKARKKARKQAKRIFGRRKVCRFCADPNLQIDYKDPRNLKFFSTETGKMIPRRISGNCARHQRQVTTAIQRARQVALLPYSSQQA